MVEGWVRIYSSTEVFKAKIAEDILKQNGIESHIVSKPDSAIPSLGAADLYAPPEKAEAAIKVLRANKIGLDEEE